MVKLIETGNRRVRDGAKRGQRMLIDICHGLAVESEPSSLQRQRVRWARGVQRCVCEDCRASIVLSRPVIEEVPLLAVQVGSDVVVVEESGIKDTLGDMSRALLNLRGVGDRRLHAAMVVSIGVHVGSDQGHVLTHRAPVHSAPE